MNNADRRRIANCFDRLTKLTYPASGVPMRSDRLREAIRKERALAMEIMGEDCDCAEPAEPRDSGTVELKLETPAEFIKLTVEELVSRTTGCLACLRAALEGGGKCSEHGGPDDETA